MRPCDEVRDVSEILALPVKREWRGITLHHTYRPTTKDYRGRETVEAIRRYHIEHNGWAEIGYHFLIGPDGRIFWGRPLSSRGAHAVIRKPGALRRFGTRSWPNRWTIGVCVIGNFDSEDVPSPAWDALGELLQALSRKFNFGPEGVFFHRDFAYKTCPGMRVRKEEVKTLLSAERPGCEVILEGEVIGTAYIEGGRAYFERVPVRKLAEKLGFEVIWDADRHAVILRK